MSFVNNIRTLVANRMAALQFKRKYGIFWRDISPESRGFLGIGASTYAQGKIVSIWPTVGVRFDEVYAAQRQLNAVPESKTNPTLAVPLHYLVPERPEYAFQDGVEPSDVIERLASHVQRYALPFYAAHSSIDGVLASLSTPLDQNVSGIREFVPVVHFIRGEWRAAMAYAEDKVSSMDTTRGTGKAYLQFVEALRVAVADHRATFGAATSL
jgi:hypothetical protein